MDGGIEGGEEGEGRCLRVVAGHGGLFFLGLLAVARDKEKVGGRELWETVEGWSSTGSSLSR